jgi:hypothetical protein
MAESNRRDRLSPEHLALLQASGLDDRAIHYCDDRGQRRYETLTDLPRLFGLGYSDAQVATGGGLLIRDFGTGGEVWGTQLRPDRPRLAKSSGKKPTSSASKPAAPKRVKYETPPGLKARLDVPPFALELVHDELETLIVTEGARKADSAACAGVAAISLRGVGSWNVPDWESLSMSGRSVVIIFDSDAVTKKEVQTQEQKLAAYLTDLGAEVQIARLQPGSEGEKVGLDDFIAAGGDLGELIAEAEPFEAARQPVDDKRPALDVSNDADLFDYLHAYLGVGVLSGLFLRGGTTVRVPLIGEDGYQAPAKEADEDGPAQVSRVDPRTLRAMVQFRTWTYRHVLGVGRVHKTPPIGACDSALALAGEAPALPRLRGVVHAPVVLKDGSILDKPGYDPDTRLLYLPNGLEVPPVPAEPTKRDCVEAVEFVDYILQDFRFASDSDRANYIGALLTPLLRVMLPAPWPLVVLSAPMQGSGKSLLARIARILHGGVFRSEFPGDEEELRKAITAVLMTTTGPVVQFDNATRTLRSGNMTALLTSDEWSDRILGVSESVTVPNDRLWVVTGNNVSLGGDLPRRALWVTIDPKMSRPWERTDLKEPDLAGFVTEHRGEILAALLTLTRAWVVAGQPKVEGIRSDSYGYWASHIAGILKFASIPGCFLDPSTDRTPVGADDDEWRTFLMALYEKFADRRFTVKELNERLGLVAEYLPAALAEKYDRGQTGLKISIGKWFKNRDGRYAGRYVLRGVGVDSTNNTTTWRVFRDG